MKKIMFLWVLIFAMLAFLCVPQVNAAAKPNSLTLYKGQTYNLKNITKSISKNPKKIKYSLSKKKIVFVNSKGKIRALKKGTVILTAQSKKYPKRKIKIEITVKNKKKSLKSKKAKTRKSIELILPQKEYEDKETLDTSPDIENISGIGEDDSVPFVNNRLLLYFREDTADVRKKEIFREIKAVEIGALQSIDLFQIEVKQIFENFEEITLYADFLCNTYPEILSAEPEWIFFKPQEMLYDDLWNASDWNVYAPDGENWWAEAVNAPLAWEYAGKMSQIPIGIIDNGFDCTHEDLQLQFSSQKRKSENSIERHGTHVAGIIGAKANNGKGIAGLAWMHPIYVYDWQPSENQSWMTNAKILNLFVEAVEDGCKVINLSLGTSGNLKDHTKNYWKIVIDSWGKITSVAMGRLLEQEFDFVVVQSAGNGAKDGIGVDAVNNGHFSSITEENCYFSSKVTKSEIMNRIFIVGAAEQKTDGNYRQTIFSNGGENVRICAPGRNIYSTLPENSYGELSGTSMAAPIVAAAASMVWAVNEDFSGEDVQEILLYAADKQAGGIPMVNAGLAVEEAVRRSENTDKAETNGYKIVLTWQEIPEDLDAHLWGEDITGKYIHIGFGGNTCENAELIWDDPYCYGPEIITIAYIESFTSIIYTVHNYTDSCSESVDVKGMRLAQSKAVVKVYKGNTLLKIYEVPQMQKGNVWSVFSMDSKGNITDINRIN